MRVVIASLFALLLGNSVSLESALGAGASPNSRFLLFFVPDAAELSTDAQQIIGKAAAIAKTEDPSRVEISLPNASMKEAQLSGTRFRVIKAALVAEGIAPGLIARRTMAKMRSDLPGAEAHGEITFVNSPSGRQMVQAVLRAQQKTWR